MSVQRPERIPRIDHEPALRAVEGEILRRVDTLYRLSRHGCDYMRGLSDQFQQTRQALCKATGNECAFLDDEYLVDLLMQFESLNPEVRRGAPAIAELIEEHKMKCMLVAFAKQFADDPEMWETAE